MKSKIGIVIPVFNESIRLNKEYWLEIGKNSHIRLIFVNDGSTDSSLSKLEEICLALNSNANEEVAIVLNLESNRGKSYAVQAGFEYVSNIKELSTIAFLDADGAFSSTEISQRLLLHHYQRLCDWGNVNCLNKVYWSSRVALSGSKIERSLPRHYLNRIVITFLGMGLNNVPYDTQSGFKIFPRCHHTDNIFRDKFKTRWLFDFEIFLRIAKRDRVNPVIESQIIEFPVMSWVEVPNSKITFKEIIRIIWECLVILKIRHKWE